MWILLYCLVGFLLLIIAALLIKIYLMQKSAKQISDSLAYILSADTNILIDMDSADRHMRRLASQINKQLLALRAAQHRFYQGDMEIKNAVTNISHDLRTPLTAICGYIELLEQTDKPDDVKRYITIIKERAELMKQLTEELFHYSIIISSSDGFDIEPVSLNGALEESLAAFYTHLKQQGIVPKVQMPNEQIICKLNKSSLSRVLSNIITNAIKYSDKDLEITLLNSGTIIFANTALSLNSIQVEKLFDRFYTVNSATNSTGLGLAIARTLVEQMHGTITAKYENNKLYITLQFSCP